MKRLWVVVLLIVFVGCVPFRNKIPGDEFVGTWRYQELGSDRDLKIVVERYRGKFVVTGAWRIYYVPGEIKGNTLEFWVKDIGMQMVWDKRKKRMWLWREYASAPLGELGRVKE